MIFIRQNQFIIIIYVLFILNFVSLEISAESNTQENAINLSNGLGDSYDWHTLEEGQILASKLNKPMMVIIHALHCPASKELRTKFSSSEKTLNLSQNFIMINVLTPFGGEANKKWSPDGRYTPRILFLSPDGVVQKEIYNKYGNPRYKNFKYFYQSVATVNESMKNALNVMHLSGEL